jgi:UDP-N-acetylglucosamine 2-epimerase (non-hydrolysing)
MNGEIFFFIGTEAELIKLFPIMLALRQREVAFRIIASGQNDIRRSTVLRALNNGHLDLLLSNEADIQKTATGLLRWYGQTRREAAKRIKAAFPSARFQQACMVVHGDTVSTMMGAAIGRQLGMTVAHVEAGLRSHHWLNPFPEEIDRMITSRKARLHFAPGEEATANLAHAHGEVLNTEYNPISDSLAYSRSIVCTDERILALLQTPYFIFALHRQENLAQKALLQALIDRILEQAQEMRCVMILHKPTEQALSSMGLLERLLHHPNVTIFPRVEYFDFMKLLEGAQFVITDGGSNQEELSYMGKPCLVLRKRTERQDGIGRNVLLYGGDIGRIASFVANYRQYERPPMSPDFSPAERIADRLERFVRES